VDLDKALDAALAASAGNVGAVGQAEIESLLTDGYARVLELEAERRLLIGQLQAAGAVEAITERLVSLRDRLDEVNKRYGPSRKDQVDRGASSRRRADEQLSS
jgi:hypothetical protein